ncbi:PFL_4669 family integrating conjugative element protein [Denitromonas iodatirespirans]|uniref:TIGR03761 family integrating conjugative element protein n=1 Tax=Denitromonas iodatirespirans TaxID=2795389 RepID=A0A944H6J1_DENI1|nr:TIGR03761 family integrating conjugative element protein [Denitromonas iodatirespirans]MBT0960218.1 TIGR03761 family integrating conjugative element protein [Denitromonas iodatirespirans]
MSNTTSAASRHKGTQAAELPPGTFVPYPGAAAEQFLRTTDSPFDDGYDMAAEQSAVQHLIDADDPDPSDPMWWRFAEFQQREGRLRQMRAEYKSMNAAPTSVTQQEAYKLRELGGLVDDDDDLMTLHTKEGYRMFLGRRRDPDGRLPAIPGGRTLASSLRLLWARSALDNPYADWALLLADQYVAQLKEELRSEADELKGRLEAMADRGLKLSVLRSREPKAVELGFKSPYGYAVAQLIVEYDYFVRIVKTLIRKDLLSDEEGRARIRHHTRRFRADCMRVFRFEKFLVQPELYELSRRDFVPGADEMAVKRVQAVLQYFGPVPQEVFTGALAPRHSRRRANLSAEERQLLATVAAQIEAEAQAQADAGPDEDAEGGEELL